MAKRLRLRNSSSRRRFRSLRGEALEGRNLLAAVTFVVNSELDGNDPNPLDGICETAPGNGICTLRAAITTANAVPGLDAIHFNIPGPGVKTIQPQSSYGITDPVVIDAYTQPLASPNSLSVGNNAVLLIELDGSAVGGGSAGLNVQSSGTVVRGLVMNRYQNTLAIQLGSGGGHVVEGNYIGTDVSGTLDLGNQGGILVLSSNNRIGGTTPAARNVISGNNGGNNGLMGGIRVSGANNQIQGNYIGTNRTGLGALPNSGGGIEIDQLTSSATNNLIGGTTAGAGNVISGNGRSGVRIHSFASNNSVKGNLIGVDATGADDLPNQGSGLDVLSSSNNVIGGATSAERNVISGNTGFGLQIQGLSSDNIVQGNYIGLDASGTMDVGNGSMGISLSDPDLTVIGGTVAGAANVISGNQGAGIEIKGSTSNTSIQGNVIGLNAAGTVAIGNSSDGIRIIPGNSALIGGTAPGAGNRISGNTGAGVRIVAGIANRIQQNSIYLNGQLGIDLAPFSGPPGVTLNDSGDGDFGPNNLQNYPTITSVVNSAGSTTVEATLNSTPNTAFTIEFFSSNVADPSGFGEGQVFVHAATVTTDSSGNASISVTIPILAPGHVVTATATNPSRNTSEFSAAVLVPLNFSTTTTITSDDPDPSVVGEVYDVSWTVTADVDVTAGTVTVDDGEGNNCSAPVLVGQCSLASTSAGLKTLTASYSGIGLFNPSSDTEPHQVNQADTSIVIVSDLPDPSVVGEPYSVSWTVSVNAPGAGVPTGTVTVDDGNGNTCTAGVSDGSCSIVSTSVGSKTLTASYSGDGNFTSSSDTESHDVNQASTTLTITSDSPDPSVVGQSYLVTWSLSVNSPGAGTPTGTVTVDDGTGGTCSAAVSIGECSIVSTSAGSKIVSASYSGDANFQTSSDTENHDVNQASTTLTITSDSPDPSVVGQSYLVTWSLSVNAPGAGTPTGTVTVEDGTGGTCSAAVSIGECSIVSTSAGSKILSASYSGDANFQTSSDTENHDVNQASTTLTITSDSPDPSVVGQSYMVTWSLSVNAPGAGTPTGTVMVEDGTGGTCSAAVSVGECSIVSTSAGSKTLTANYSGDANFETSSDSENHDVNQASTTLTITSDSPDPSVVGQSYLVTWSVAVNAPGAGTPTGTVTVDDGTGGTCSAAVSVGECSIVSTSAGSKTLIASYSGDANFETSSDTENHDVNQASTTLTITSDSPDPSVVGQSYLVTWSVAVNAPGAGTPTGTVTVDDGTGGTCSAAVSVGGCSIVSTSAGSKTLTANYSGDANFETSSDTENHTVSRASTTLTITSDSPDPSVVGQSYLVTWSLAVNAPGAGTPTGTVTVDDGAGGTCSAAVSVGGCSIVSTSAGSKTLTANYSGDANFVPSSDTENHVVDRANTTLTITSDSPDPSAVGQPYLVTWSLTVNAPGSGTPTGTVLVFDNNGNYCTAEASAGGCVLVSTSSGTKVLTAVYVGSADFVGSYDFELHQVATWVIQPDVCDPTKTQLVVGGTTGDDTIVITRPSGSTTRVKVNGTTLGDFTGISRVVVFAQAGNDEVDVDGAVQLPAWLHGGTGDDELKGGGGADVLWGDEGNDRLEGSGGRDLMIGGTGADRLFGNGGDDILIAGYTEHDAVDTAICDIMDEWTRSDASYNQRVRHLDGTDAGGHNGSVYLTDDTVLDDGMQDVLTGNQGLDWFLLNFDGDGFFLNRDRSTDNGGSEVVDDIDEAP